VGWPSPTRTVPPAAPSASGSGETEALRSGEAGQADQRCIFQEIAAFQVAFGVFIDGDVPDVAGEIAKGVDFVALGHFCLCENWGLK
ncbi:hypothetical protein, partial [Mesorhizobium sp. M2C.T.Ca.TU.002.02.1.1]|uniref:hypothetical protein n=1 Tax=Mesorhizobium sp. M2C.T.Ca.TU.002.02.1.1 TaxID=2496788 RepID=UPI0019D2EFC5